MRAFGVALLVCLLAGLHDSLPKDPLPKNLTLTDPQVQRLMAYHGVHGLRMERERIYIKRDAKWVEVWRNPDEKASVNRRVASAER